MSDSTEDTVRAREEAAGWFARFSHLSVSSETLQEWREWRRDPANVAAYDKVQATWDRARSLAANPKYRDETAGLLQRYPARRARTRRLPRELPWALATASVLALAVGVAMWIGFQQQPNFSTKVGEQRLVVLADGSHVRLNTDSAIRVRYNPEERRVTLLRGEAFFEAAHNAKQPFIVDADGAQVRAIGTKFDVRRESNAVQVTLLEGKVGVADRVGGGATTLIPNQQLTVTSRGISPPRSANAAEASGWTTGRLTFRGVPLQDAIAEVNRYASHRIVLEGPTALAQQPLSGVFDTSDTLAFVSAVSGIYDLQAVTTPEGAVRLSPRAKPSEG
jgi:transmembrane sensor